MPTPLNPLVAEMVEKLNANLRESFEERAAIFEFDAELSREYAESLALINVLTRYPSACCGITVFQASNQWLVTTDISEDSHDIATVINEQFSGTAVLIHPQ